MATIRSARQSTMVMAFMEGEPLPKAGDTRIMNGNYGTRYAVTIHRVKAQRDNEYDGKHYILLDVVATKRVIDQA